MQKQNTMLRFYRRTGKLILCVLVMSLINSCERFPSNPQTDSSESKWVYIRHLATEYISTETSLTGLAAKKVNRLTFEIEAKNFEAKALEVFGRVILEGPPYGREHNLHFRTDLLLQKEDGSSLCLENIRSELPYQLVRSKFPTNEYSPFMGDQGKVQTIIITDVIAYDANGKGTHIPLRTQVDPL